MKVGIVFFVLLESLLTSAHNLYGEELLTTYDQSRICHPLYHPIYNLESPFKEKCPALCRMRGKRKAARKIGKHRHFNGPYEYEVARYDLGWVNLSPCAKCKAVGIDGICIELYCRKRAACALLDLPGPLRWKQ